MAGPWRGRARAEVAVRSRVCGASGRRLHLMGGQEGRGYFYRGARGPRCAGPGVQKDMPRPDSSSNPSLARGGRGVRWADPT
jgi:hypothetical protein